MSTIETSKKSLPEFLRPIFWSYKFEDLEREGDKKLIIFQILNHGGLQDWQWLFTNYSKEEIKESVQNSLASAWFKKPLGLWEGILNVKAKNRRFPGLSFSKGWI